MTDFFQGLGATGQTRGFVLHTVCREHGPITSVPFPGTDPDTLGLLMRCALQVDSILYGCPEEDLTIEVRESNIHALTTPHFGRAPRIRR